MKSFLKSVGKKILDTATVEEGGCVGDIPDYIDTGSYTVNAVLSGSIHKGLPSNKISGFTGVSGVGKTYFALQAVKGFLAKHPENVAIYYDSEAAITSEMLISRGIDPSRVIVKGVATIEDFRTSARQVLKQYKDEYLKRGDEESRLMLVLDSMGQLSSIKELEDIESGANKADMTKAKSLKATFRALTLISAEYKVPFVLTNHVYAQIGQMYASNVQAGGTGFVYAASIIVELTTAKDKDGTDVVGAVITMKNTKGRLAKTFAKAKTLLNFETGLDKWYGMDEFAIESGAWKKVGNMIEVEEDGVTKKKYAKALMREPEKYFTPEVMEKIEKWVNKTFMYGSDVEDLEDALDEVEND